MSLVAPELAEVAERLGDPASYQRFMVSLAMMMGGRPDLFRGPPTPLRLFMDRHGGMDVLRDLTRSQAPGRTRLLEAAPLSRSGLARRNNVSRTQVMRLLADAQAQGLLSVTRDRVVFSPVLSDDAERHLAFTIQTARLAGAAALG
jgi:CRP-like cAMP-binding protein